MARLVLNGGIALHHNLMKGFPFIRRKWTRTLPYIDGQIGQNHGPAIKQEFAAFLRRYFAVADGFLGITSLGQHPLISDRTGGNNRLEQITDTANLLLSVDASLQKVDEQLKAKPLDVKEQVQKELAEPLKAAIESCRKLDEQMKSLLARLDHKISQNQRVLNIAFFASGFTGGGLIVACLFHLLSSH